MVCYASCVALRTGDLVVASPRRATKKRHYKRPRNEVFNGAYIEYLTYLKTTCQALVILDLKEKIRVILQDGY